MDGSSGGGEDHVDEGTIHAWLDDALDAERAARVASHVQSCPECAGAVAEARGLIAGASRVVRALDDETASPTATAPAWGSAPPSAGSGSLWRLLRVTPARAAIAASLLVALGITLTYPRAGQKEVAQLENRASAGSAMAVAAPAPTDGLLDSALKRNIAAAQAPRALEPAPGVAIPRAPGPGENVAMADAGAPARVAGGRAAVRAMRETGAPPPDQSRTAQTPVANEPLAPQVAAANAPASRPEPGVMAGKVARTVPAVGALATAAECYRVESATPGSAWGPVALPFVVALQPANSPAERGGATIVAPQSSNTASVSAVWSRRAGDTLQLDLRRIGYSGQLVLGAGEEARRGTMRSGQIGGQLSAVVTTGVTTGERSEKAPARRAMGRVTAPVVTESAPSADMAGGQAVTARRIVCAGMPD
jgi:hypothetical protein